MSTNVTAENEALYVTIGALVMFFLIVVVANLVLFLYRQQRPLPPDHEPYSDDVVTGEENEQNLDTPNFESSGSIERGETY